MFNRNIKDNNKVTPYDDSMWNRHSMYDSLPYTWDSDLNVEKTFALISGNVIKSYQFQMKETYEVRHEG